jgi:hypothetical protein
MYGYNRLSARNTEWDSADPLEVGPAAGRRVGGFGGVWSVSGSAGSTEFGAGVVMTSSGYGAGPTAP